MPKKHKFQAFVEKYTSKAFEALACVNVICGMGLAENEVAPTNFRNLEECAKDILAKLFKTFLRNVCSDELRAKKPVVLTHCLP